jgi:hypothetical protein
MKYTGKWWDNPNRSERERVVAYWSNVVLNWMIGIVIGIVIIANI